MKAVVNPVGSGYNRGVRLNQLHAWDLTVAEARETQARLAATVSREGAIAEPRVIAGVDVSVSRERGMATGAVVVLEYPSLVPVEVRASSGELAFPYVPGLLSFREARHILAACEMLETEPDLVIVDGQGIAHPRRIGLASHLGLFLDTPTIGCAKSRLCGRHDEPGTGPGSVADLVDGIAVDGAVEGETVGAVLRTRAGVKPVYVSVGHRIDLMQAVHWVLECCRGYRLPEPIRLAHEAAGQALASSAGGGAAVAGR